MFWIANNQIKITQLRLGYPLALTRKLVAHTFERKIIKLEDIKINQDKEKENFPYSRINPSTNLQLYNNSSKVVIDKLEKNKTKN